jgi:chloride channel 3/4/5
MNSYPFLDNKHKPIFDGDIADLVPRVRRERLIDITNSPTVPATKLRAKLDLLYRAGELDGGLPIVREDVLVGLIPAPDLEFALDQLLNESESLCLMDRIPSADEDSETWHDPTDFTPYIDSVSPRDLRGEPDHTTDNLYDRPLWHWTSGRLST